MKNGFTLIELLAIIIILAIVALISAPIVLNVVEEARSSANKSSVAMYADAVKLAVIDNYFENQSYPAVNIDWVNDNVEYGGEKIICKEAYYTEIEGVTLHECTIGNTAFNYVDEMKVSAEDTVYCYTKGKVYTDCEDITYKTYYDLAREGGLTSSQVGYVDESNANQPELFDNMVAVRYDYTEGKWFVANTNEKWYDYDNQEWANAVVFNKGILKNIGEVINLDTEVSQMYVWIPRYKYTIFNGQDNNGSVEPKEINISFESGIASTGTVTCVDNIDGSETCTDSNGNIINEVSTYTHPAFTFGGKELTGIWVAKFEISNVIACIPKVGSIGIDCDLTDLGVQIKPNVQSWRGARVSTFFTTIKSLSAEYELNADSHMMKNMEWGAVAYLSHSKYGKGIEEIWINNGKYTTGCAGSSANAATNYLECENTYDTVNGQQASTTGNIYGVYDMSGGTFEFVMSNMLSSTNKLQIGTSLTYNSGFTGTTSDGNTYTGVNFPESKYYDVYKYGTSKIEYNRGKLGDGIKETVVTYNSHIGWHSDDTPLLVNVYTAFIRGGGYYDASEAGIFNSYTFSSGYAHSAASTRVTIVMND